MNFDRQTAYYVGLVHELCKLQVENEWVEFKYNNDTPDMIGEYLSALANSAALSSKANAYLLWGVDDKTHEVIGTTFKPSAAKVGQESLENWLLRLLNPKIKFHFVEVSIHDQPVVLLEIGAAFRHPVRFKDQEYIRIGSHKKKLKEFPEKERELWRIFDQIPFERGIAAEHVSADEVLRLLDYPTFFDLLQWPLPEGRETIFEALKGDNIIHPCQAGDWNITNLGAILFAKKLDEFPSLKRKAMRIVQYKGNGRLETLREQTDGEGYANGFKRLISLIMTLVPSNEIIRQALRETLPLYPELAVRELVANALIHQDFFVTGAGPMVELFDDRMEITNPGAPLVSTERFLDTPPKSRNETLASLMRRFGICEERGSGIDKVVSQTESYQLPAPLFETVEDHTRVVLFAHRDFKEMDKNDRIRACYLHACLGYVQRSYMTNSTLRERFGIDAKNSAMVSRIIRDTLEAGRIRSYDDSVGNKAKKYLPSWA